MIETSSDQPVPLSPFFVTRDALLISCFAAEEAGTKIIGS
jgi:hypothetical protein